MQVLLLFEGQIQGGTAAHTPLHGLGPEAIAPSSQYSSALVGCDGSACHEGAWRSWARAAVAQVRSVIHSGCMSNPAKARLPPSPLGPERGPLPAPHPAAGVAQQHPWLLLHPPPLWLRLLTPPLPPPLHACPPLYSACAPPQSRSPCACHQAF
jgi:hypothetical protein